MTILQNRTSQLTTILQAWNELEEDSQKKSINFISEFILSASLFQKFSGDENLETQLTSFQENYNKLFGSDLTKLGTSDLSQKNVGILNNIKEIDLQEIDLQKKQENISSHLAEKGLNIQEFRESLLAESLDKYSHAHFKVMQNYGNFIEHLEANLDSEKKKEFDNLKATLSTTEDKKEFFKNLVLLNNCADIPTNFDKLTTKFGIDGLEEHTLINQGTLYRSYLDRGDSINKILGLTIPQMP